MLSALPPDGGVDLRPVFVRQSLHLSGQRLAVREQQCLEARAVAQRATA
ncbi:hypothetical protein MFUL124B02_33470 [Myxococcus fulvus 124B02]|nr:hypothetical protein MFUL124B02_33470 [Myxococcus fulvus 124B02]